MTDYSMQMHAPTIRFGVAPTSSPLEPVWKVSIIVTAQDAEPKYYDLDPAEARAHAQHLLAVADEVEHLRKKADQL